MNVRIVGGLLVVAAAILIAWEISVRQYDRPDIFSFLMGGLLLLEAAVALQRFRHIVLFRYARRAEGIRGKIEYSRRLALSLSFFDLYGFVALYVFIFLVSSSWFFLGGALTCFVASRRLRDWVMIRT